MFFSRLVQRELPTWLKEKVVLICQGSFMPSAWCRHQSTESTGSVISRVHRPLYCVWDLYNVSAEHLFTPTIDENLTVSGEASLVLTLASLPAEGDGALFKFDLCGDFAGEFRFLEHYSQILCVFLPLTPHIPRVSPWRCRFQNQKFHHWSSLFLCFLGHVPAGLWFWKFCVPGRDWVRSRSWNFFGVGVGSRSRNFLRVGVWSRSRNFWGLESGVGVRIQNSWSRESESEFLVFGVGISWCQ